MTKNKKNKLKKKNHNALKIGNEMTKTLDKQSHSPTSGERKTSSLNRSTLKLNIFPNNIEITNLIIKKISNLGEATKKWCQTETKNIMNLIKTKKKQIMTQILISTKSACTKLLNAKEIDLKQPILSIDTPFNITRPKTIKRENNIPNKKSSMSPISQSSPYANANEISKIHQRNISELLENTLKVFITDITPSSIKCDNHQDHTSKINIKCNTHQHSKAKSIQAPQKLMSLNTKPSRQLEDMLNNMHEKFKNKTKNEDKARMHKKPSATTLQAVWQISQKLQKITQQYSDADLINLNSPSVKSNKIEAKLLTNVGGLARASPMSEDLSDYERIRIEPWKLLGNETEEIKNVKITCIESDEIDDLISWTTIDMKL